MTDDEPRRLLPPAFLEDLAETMRAARNGPVKVLDLPRKVRIRLWCHHHVDGTAIWLADHHMRGLAVALWRICGMWR